MTRCVCGCVLLQGVLGEGQVVHVCKGRLEAFQQLGVVRDMRLAAERGRHGQVGGNGQQMQSVR